MISYADPNLNFREKLIPGAFDFVNSSFNLIYQCFRFVNEFKLMCIIRTV